MLGDMCQNAQIIGHIPIKLLRYIVSELNYGGKLTHKDDQSILSHQVKTFINRRVFDETTRSNRLQFGDYPTMDLESEIKHTAYDLTGT